MKSLPVTEPSPRRERTNHASAPNPSAAANPPLTSGRRAERAFGGLFVRRYRWSVSLKGMLVIFLMLLASGIIVVLRIYPFLAVTERVNADVLVVEGWVHPYAVEASAEEFKNRHYRQIFTTGGPVVGKGGYINDYQTSASVGAGMLRKRGIPTELIQMVPSRVIGRDRTYSSAIALRDWFHDHQVQVSSLNVVTEGAHARRTRFLFKKALGREVQVGVIAIPSPDYDADRWWSYSEGVEEIIRETIAYIYVKFVPMQDNAGPDTTGKL